MMLVSDSFYLPYRPSAVLKITGEDALAFLQGQFTQELRFPTGKLCVYGLWLNQKGKVLADSFALRDGETWWLVSTSSPAATIRERLEAYIIADDVAVEDVTLSWKGIALVGVDLGQRLEKPGVAFPAGSEWISPSVGLLFRGRRAREDSWEWLIPAEAPLPPAILAAGLREGDRLELERRRIAAGIPLIPDELGPNDLPNEAGLEDEAISYSKGCYLGQEVMARLKSMGQVRRQLIHVRGEGIPPKCPVGLYVGSKRVGELRSAIPLPTGAGFVGLAMISLVGLDRDKPLSLSPDGPVEVRVVGGAS